MSLLPDVERELMRVARDPDPRAKPVLWRSWWPSAVSAATRGLPAAAVVLLVLVAVGVGALFLAGLRTGNGGAGNARLPSGEAAGSVFPGAPRTQRGDWRGAGNLCPKALPNRYLPARAGCVSVALAGQRDLVIVYAHLSDRRVGRLFVPSFFVLEVVRSGRPTLRTRLGHGVSNQSILLVGRAAPPDPARIFIKTGEISSGSFAVVYSLWRGRLLAAGETLSYGRDSALAATFACRATGPSGVVQRTWVLLRGGENGWWRRTVTTFAWRNARLVRVGRSNSLQHGLVVLVSPGKGCSGSRG